MPEEKKKWITPQLIILVRGKPEEGVLSSCKVVTVAGDPYNSAGMCKTGGTAPCFNCLDRLTS